MPSQRVVLTLTGPAGCPVHKAGERIVVELPGIVTKDTTSICAHAVGGLFPYVLAVAHGADPATLAPPGGFRCAGGHGCTWAVAREAAAEAPSGLTMALTRDDRDVEFIVKHMKSIPLFAPLPETSIRALIPYLEIKKLPERTNVIKQGEPGTHLYILVKGEVDVIKVDGQKRENVLARLRKGEVFGEMSLITGEPCSATIRTATTVSALVVGKPDFERILAEHPLLNIYFNKLLAARLRKTMVHIEEEIAKGVLGKLSMISLPELTQTISVNSRTGILRLYRGGETGEIFFRDGQVVDVALGEVRGEEAFYKTLMWSDGDFRFVPGEVTGARKVTQDTMGLLMEGLRRMDEASRKAAAAAPAA